MKKKADNKAHLHGDIVRVKEVNFGQSGKVAFFADIKTTEAYKDGEETKYKDSFTSVTVSSSDKEFIEKIRQAGKDAEDPKNRHEVSLDGVFTTRESTSKDGIKYENQMIVVDQEDFELDAPLDKENKEVRNFAELTGNISKIDMKDGFAIIDIATHYYAPGAPKKDAEGNSIGEPVKFKDGSDGTRLTSFVETRISEKFRPETFAAIKKGEIKVGSFVDARGQIHNNNYTDKNGVNRYKSIIDLNKIEIKVKKAEKVEEEQKAAPKVEKVEEKTEKKPVKKATSKKQRTL